MKRERRKRRKQVTLRLPVEVIKAVKRVAADAGVSPTEVFNVLLALHIQQRKP